MHLFKGLVVKRGRRHWVRQIKCRVVRVLIRRTSVM